MLPGTSCSLLWLSRSPKALGWLRGQSPAVSGVGQLLDNIMYVVAKFMYMYVPALICTHTHMHTTIALH